MMASKAGPANLEKSLEVAVRRAPQEVKDAHADQEDISNIQRKEEEEQSQPGLPKGLPISGRIGLRII